MEKTYKELNLELINTNRILRQENALYKAELIKRTQDLMAERAKNVRIYKCLDIEISKFKKLINSGLNVFKYNIENNSQHEDFFSDSVSPFKENYSIENSGCNSDGCSGSENIQQPDRRKNITKVRSSSMRSRSLEEVDVTPLSDFTFEEEKATDETSDHEVREDNPSIPGANLTSQTLSMSIIAEDSENESDVSIEENSQSPKQNKSLTLICDKENSQLTLNINGPAGCSTSTPYAPRVTNTFRAPLTSINTSKPCFVLLEKVKFENNSVSVLEVECSQSPKFNVTKPDPIRKSFSADANNRLSILLRKSNSINFNSPKNGVTEIKNENKTKRKKPSRQPLPLRERPKRSAAPTSLVEPKLNEKKRQP